MEDDVNAKSDEPNKVDTTVNRRGDEIGRLAHLFVGMDGPPDFTVGPPLADEIRHVLGDAEANFFIRKVFQRLANLHRNQPRQLNRRDRVRQISRIQAELALDLAPYMLDFTNFCTMIGRMSTDAHEPEKLIEKTRAAIDMIRLKLDRPRTMGQQVMMPDGRRGIVVALPDATGCHGLVPIEDEEYGVSEMGVDGLDYSDPDE